MVFHVETNFGKRAIVQKLWARGKEELTPNVLKDTFLLAKSVELTAFHYATLQANTEALHDMWECAKEKLTKEE